MSKIFITDAAFDVLTSELKNLKSVERQAVIQAIATAREHGDLKENAEYHAAREKQSFLEGRIAELESSLSRAEVINPANMTGTTSTFGATVTLVDCDNDEEFTYALVGELEADIRNGRLSVQAPLAREILGKEVGDSFDFTTPRGTKTYEILAIKFCAIPYHPS